MNEGMKQKLKAAGSYIAVVAVSAAVLWIMSLTAQRVGESTADDALLSRYSGILSAQKYEALDISEAGAPYDAVTAAYRGVNDGNTAGYIVEMTVSGYGGDMEVTVGVSADAERITGIRIGNNSETEGLGSRVAENAFLSQFSAARVPVSLGRSALSDGTYFAQSSGFDGGYRDNVTVTVENGRITHVLWDGESESGGKSKRQASIDGEYVMTAEGLMWHEQAQLLESRLIELQDPSKLVFGDDGKTDAVAGVSIRISPFVSLAQQCCAEAGGTSDLSAVDGVSGATVSSRAVVDAANLAATFTDRFILENGSAIAADEGDNDD